MCRAMNYISNNLHRELQLEDIAQTACFSKFHFHRLFHAMTNETVSNFIKRLRLEAAANSLLYDPKLDIAQLACNYQFSSSQNFARAFKQHFNQTPTQFRAKKSKQRHTQETVTIYDVDNVGWSSINPELLDSLDICIKKMPAWHVAFTRHIGSYNYVDCSRSFEKLIPWAEKNALLDKEKIISLSWDSPEITAIDKCRFDACITVPESFQFDGEMALQTITEGTHAVYNADIINHDFQTPWLIFMAHWLPQSGYLPDDKPRYGIVLEHGVDHPEGKWKVALCCPITPL